MTTHMVRKQIYISKRQELVLKRLSQARGISEAEIVRQAIDRETLSEASVQPTADEDAWQQTVAFMRSLRERRIQFSEPYHWNREELYAERMNRYSEKPASPSKDRDAA